MSWREGLQLGAFPSWGTQRTVFCKILCSEKQIFPRFFYYLGKTKKFQMTVAFMYNFRSLSDKFLRFPFLFKVRLFFVEERKPKTFGFKNAMESGIRKYLTFVIGQIASKIFGEIILKPSFPQETEQIKILQSRLECISREVKVLQTANVLEEDRNRRQVSLFLVYRQMSLLLNQTKIASDKKIFAVYLFGVKNNLLSQRVLFGVWGLFRMLKLK